MFNKTCFCGLLLKLNIFKLHWNFTMFYCSDMFSQFIVSPDCKEITWVMFTCSLNTQILNVDNLCFLLFVNSLDL